ncbi:hypothetical protein MNBD_GAMMA21-1403 [hydrothermal vent metagenome]|uniref:Uncharacterized protein n=1 Tax=hydrothermal vent metagenome TaxID=652676 RepID=A0A3B1AWG7_9ZZZZ
MKKLMTLASINPATDYGLICAANLATVTIKEALNNKYLNATVHQVKRGLYYTALGSGLLVS